MMTQTLREAWHIYIFQRIILKEKVNTLNPIDYPNLGSRSFEEVEDS